MWGRPGLPSSDLAESSGDLGEVALERAREYNTIYFVVEYTIIQDILYNRIYFYTNILYKRIYFIRIYYNTEVAVADLRGAQGGPPRRGSAY